MGVFCKLCEVDWGESAPEECGGYNNQACPIAQTLPIRHAPVKSATPVTPTHQYNPQALSRSVTTPGDFWLAIKEQNTEASQAISCWTKSPENGPLYCQALSRLAPMRGNDANAMKRLLGSAKSLKYSNKNIKEYLFSGGFWCFGFTSQSEDPLVNGLICMRKIMREAHKNLQVNDPDTLLIAEAYFGSKRRDPLPILKRYFSTLHMTIGTGQASNLTLLICRGDENAMAIKSDGGRLLGYVDSSDGMALGWDLSTVFRCVYITKAGMEASDDTFPIDSQWRTGATLLHELTHIVPCADVPLHDGKIKDLQFGSRKWCYGRDRCIAYSFRYNEEQEAQDPLGNADSLALFALDVRLLKKGLVSKAKMFEKLDIQTVVDNE